VNLRKLEEEKIQKENPKTRQKEREIIEKRKSVPKQLEEGN